MKIELSPSQLALIKVTLESMARQTKKEISNSGEESPLSQMLVNDYEELIAYLDKVD